MMQEHMFDIITVSREIEIIDMIEYLKPADFGIDTSQEVVKKFPTIGNMKNEEIFKTIFHVELLFFKNTLKTRNQLVILYHLAVSLQRTREYF